MLKKVLVYVCFLTVILASAGFIIPGLAQAGGTLVVGRGADANSLDPPESQSFEAIKCADWSFDGLVRFEGNNHIIVPSLATSWSVAEDGLTWTFKLRQGVKFHDGTPFNADAVVFSFERQRDPEHPYYSKYFTRWKAKFGQIKLTEKVDDYTVKIHLTTPAPTMLANMAFYIGFIVSPTAVKMTKRVFVKIRWARATSNS